MSVGVRLFIKSEKVLVTMVIRISCWSFPLLFTHCATYDLSRFNNHLFLLEHRVNISISFGVRF